MPRKGRSLRAGPGQKTKGSKWEVKGQEVEERVVKRPRIDEGSLPSSAPDFNPFLVEPILRKLLKKVEKVAQLKDLRKMCVLWDNVNMEEIEDRAFKGKLKAIDFQWTDRFKTKEEAQKELIEFQEDTRSIPRFFSSFKFNIPESLKILQNHSSFFSNYHIYRVEFLMSDRVDFKEFQAGIKYFLSLIGPNLKDIKICLPNSWYGRASFEPKSPNWPKLEQELVLPNLEKLVIENKEWDKDLSEFFKSTLGTGSGHITSLELPSLPGADIGSFPGLDPTRMTRLDIGIGSYGIEGVRGSSFALKYTTGLMTLVEQGMKLVDLGLKFGPSDDTPASFAQNLPSICSNITHFLATQSSTLATLDFYMNFCSTLPGSVDAVGAEVATYGKIQLPIFQVLHTLTFEHRLQIERSIRKRKPLLFSLLETTCSLPLHFPSLLNVTFDSECSMGFFFNNSDPMELAQESRFHFKRLEITQSIHSTHLDHWNKESRGNWDMLYGSLIESVDYLKVPSNVLEKVRIPWGDSLRELNTEYVSGPFKLAHLKKLQKLVIEDDRRVGNKPYVRERRRKTLDYDSDYDYSDCDFSDYDYSDPDNDQEVVTEYLNWFKEAKQLNLTSIKFIGLEIVEKGVKPKFNRYFPYRVIFDK